MFVKTEMIDGRPVIHERGRYELTIGTVEDGAFCIALRGADRDGISLLVPGMLCAKLRPGTTEDEAEVLLDNMKALVDYWEMKWRPGPPDDPGHGTVVPLRRAA